MLSPFAQFAVNAVTALGNNIQNNIAANEAAHPTANNKIAEFTVEKVMDAIGFLESIFGAPPTTATAPNLISEQDAIKADTEKAKTQPVETEGSLAGKQPDHPADAPLTGTLDAPEPKEPAPQPTADEAASVSSGNVPEPDPSGMVSSGGTSSSAS